MRSKQELNVICSASSAVATEKFYYVYDEYGEYKVVAPSLDGCLSIKGGDAGASLIRAVGGRLSAYIQLPSAVGENRKTRVYASVYDGLGNDISGVFKIVYDGDKDVFINVDKALVEITSVGDEITNVKFNGAVAEISPDGYYALGAYHKLKAELIRGEAFICRISNGEERAINATLKSRYDIRINGVQAG